MREVSSFLVPSDPDLSKVIDDAQRSLEQFVRAFHSPKPLQSSFCIWTIESKDEFVWYPLLAVDNGRFMVASAEKQQENSQHKFVTAPYILDWYFTDNRWLVGGFSIRVFLNRLSESERSEFQESLPFVVGSLNRDSMSDQLMDAIGHRDIDRVRSLLNAKPDLVDKKLTYAESAPISTISYSAKMTPLQYAIRESNQEIIDLLLESGSDVNAVDDSGLNCLFTAVDRQDSTIVQRLISMDADPNLSEPILGMIPIYLAVGFENVEIISALIAAGSDLRHKTKMQESLMHNARSVEAIDLLRGNGVGLDEQDSSGSTPLHKFLIIENLECATRIVELGAKLNIRDDQGRTPIDVAEARGFDKMFVEYLRKTAELRGEDTSDRELETAIRAAKRSLDFFVKSFQNRMPMQEDFSIRLRSTTEPASSDEWVKIQSIDGEKFFGFVESGGLSQDVIAEKEQIVDWYFVDNNWLIGGMTIQLEIDRTPNHLRNAVHFWDLFPYVVGSIFRDSPSEMLMDAIGHQDVPTIQKIIKDEPILVGMELPYANVRLKWQENTITPFQYAVKVSTMEVIELLRKNGSDINARSDLGMSCIGTAVGRDAPTIVQMLLDFGADPNLGGIDDDETPLFSAAAMGSPMLVSMLLEAGADCRHRTRLGGPMHSAGSCEVIDMLYRAGSPINEQDDYGATPLHWSISKMDNARKLISLGARIDIKNENGETPLELAAREELLTPNEIEELRNLASRVRRR